MRSSCMQWGYCMKAAGRQSFVVDGAVSTDRRLEPSRQSATPEASSGHTSGISSPAFSNRSFTRTRTLWLKNYLEYL